MLSGHLYSMFIGNDRGIFVVCRDLDLFGHQDAVQMYSMIFSQVEMPHSDPIGLTWFDTTNDRHLSANCAFAIARVDKRKHELDLDCALV